MNIGEITEPLRNFLPDEDPLIPTSVSAESHDELSEEVTSQPDKPITFHQGETDGML